MLAGILLRFGLQAFASLDVNLRCVEVCCWYGWQPRPLRALCGNCRDDYWDRDRYRARCVVTTDVVFKPVLPTYITPDFRLLTA